MNVFLDTNVVLDVLMRREPFYNDSVQVWALAERGAIRGMLSAVSLTSVFYVVRKHAGVAAARAMLRDIRRCLAFAPCDASVMDQAIDARFDDFEDAVQHFSAKAGGADVIVTRNVDHFPARDVPVLTPTAFLATRRV